MKDDAGRVLFALLEQIADAAGAHANEHFHEIRAGDGEERHAGFAGDGARQQGLTGSGRADQKYTFGDTAAQFLEFLRLAQELNDFLQLFLGLFHARHVFKRDFLLLGGVQARAALAETKGFVATALHLADHEDPESRQHDEGGCLEKDGKPGARRSVLDGDVDGRIRRLHQIIDIGIVQRNCRMQLLGGVAHLPVDIVGGDGYFRHPSGFYFIHELREAKFLVLRNLALSHDKNQHARHGNQNYPQH
jgi:hypothetical protein